MKKSVIFLSLFAIYFFIFIFLFQISDSEIPQKTFWNFFIYQLLASLIVFFIVTYINFKINLSSKTVNTDPPQKDKQIIKSFTFILFFSNIIIYIVAFFFTYEYEYSKTSETFSIILKSNQFLTSLIWGLGTNLLLLLILFFSIKYFPITYILLAFLAYSQINYFHYLLQVEYLSYSNNQIIIERHSLISEKHIYPIGPNIKLDYSLDYTVKTGKYSKMIHNFYKIYMIESQNTIELIGNIPQKLLEEQFMPVIEKINENRKISNIALPEAYSVKSYHNEIKIFSKPKGLRWYEWLFLIIGVLFIFGLLISRFNENKNSLNFGDILFIIVAILIFSVIIFFFVKQYFVTEIVSISKKQVTHQYKLFNFHYTYLKEDFNNSQKITEINTYFLKKVDYGLQIQYENKRNFVFFNDEKDNIMRLELYLKEELKKTNLMQ